MSRSLCFLGFAVVAMGCAQVGAPDGGGRDEQPPQVVQAEPAFGTTGFEGSSFVLEFDEFIQLKDIRRQMLVSPPLTEPPRVLLRGKRLSVELGEELLPDRTYIVQFGNAVSDLRESNSAEGLQYVFSTGDQLDSGKVVGRAEDAWSGEPVESARVLLFRDSLPEGILEAGLPDSLRPLPDYVGMVLDSGMFQLSFLPVGSFGCLVLDDVNGNYRADASESLAWAPMPIRVASDSAEQTRQWEQGPLRMTLPPKVPSTYSSGVRVDSSGYLRAAIMGLQDLREGPDGMSDEDIDIHLEGPDGRIPIDREGDSIWTVVPLEQGIPKGPLVLVHPSRSDTLEVRKLEAVTRPFEVGKTERTVSPDGQFRVRFAPVPERLDTALCLGTSVLEGDTLPLSASAFRLQGSRLEVGPFPPGSKVSLELLPGALTGAGGTHADTLRWGVNVRKESDYGSIRLVWDSAFVPSDAALWLLVNGSGLPVLDKSIDTEGKFGRLLPGKYGVVQVEDRDGNGRWTGLDPLLGQGPEEVIRWAEGVDVRAGWDVELQIGVLPRP